MNIVYYTLVVLIGLSVFGFDVMYLVITIAGLLVSFAFMIGSASAKYIEVRLFSKGVTFSFPTPNTASNLNLFTNFCHFRAFSSFWFENLMILETKSVSWIQILLSTMMVLLAAVGWSKMLICIQQQFVREPPGSMQPSQMALCRILES